MPHDEVAADQLASPHLDGTYHAQLSERLRCAECGGQVHSVKPWRLEDAFVETAYECPPKARGGFVAVRTYEPADKAQLDEILRRRANEDTWRRAGPSAPMVGLNGEQ